MSSIYERIETINHLLIQDIRTTKNIGLLNGKMGICIYFFHLARETGNIEHQEFAEKLIDEVYEEVGKNQTLPDFENGLAGIAWGIEHLVQHGFVEADTNIILSEVDDKIYRHIATADGLPAGLLKGALGYILYILARIQNVDIQSGSADTFIFRRLLVDLINRISKTIEEQKFRAQEPLLFDLSWDLPFCLILLTKVRTKNFYNSKIDQILNYLSPVVVSLYPRSSSNRLYLLLGMESVLKLVHIPAWRKHADILRADICLNDMLDEDLKNKSIGLVNGAVGVSYISHRLYQLTADEKLLLKREDLVNKMVTSEYWEIVKKDNPKRRNPGLLFGLAGVGIGLLELIKRGRPVEEHSV